MKRNLIFMFLASVFMFSFNAVAQNTEKVDLGFGVKQKKVVASSSAVTISGEELSKTSAINLQEALYGKLLGLTVMQSGGFVGDESFGAKLNVRGANTITENNVLVLVDGFERPLNMISVDEVESVTLLKDATAVALYGYRGINGVLLVKTKRGTAKGMNVNVNYLHKFGLRPQFEEMADAFQYANALNEARANDGMDVFYNQFELDAFKNKSFPDIYPDVNWRNEIFRELANENQANLSFDGTSEKFRYFVHFNFADNKGLLDNTELNDGYSTQLKYSSANMRINLDYQLTPSTDVRLNVLGRFVETNRPEGTTANGLMHSIYFVPSSAFPIRTTIDDVEMWGGNTLYGTNNPMARVQSTGYRKTHSRALLADIQIKQDLSVWTKGLSASITGGYDNFADLSEQRVKAFQYGSMRNIYDEKGNVLGTNSVVAGSNVNNLKFNKWLNSQWRRFNLVASVDYDRTFDKHNVDASLIYNCEQTVGDGRYHEINRANVMLASHYDYDDRYAADLVLGFTGSNRAYPMIWDFSPSASVAWNIANEGFLKNSDFVRMLKLRASVGLLHNDYVPVQGLTFEDYSGSAGSYFFSKGYKEKWGFYLKYTPIESFAHETALNYNVGLDFLADCGWGWTTDFYYNRRSNILQPSDPLNSSIYGIPAAYVNYGAIDVMGVETMLSYQKAYANGLKINSNAMFSFSRSKVLDYLESPQPYEYMSRIGGTANQVFGLESIGIFNDAAEIAESPVQRFDITRPGDIKYKDQNNDHIIDDKDIVALPFSNGIPEINYAINIGIEFKGVGIQATFQGASNFYQNMIADALYRPMVAGANVSQYYLDHCWHPGGNQANVTLPRLSAIGSKNNTQISDLWYFDASFFKLRNCQIYYNLPQSWLKAIHVKGARFFVNGENLFSIDQLPMLDPEVAKITYPILPAVSLGLSVTF